MRVLFEFSNQFFGFMHFHSFRLKQEGAHRKVFIFLPMLSSNWNEGKNTTEFPGI